MLTAVWAYSLATMHRHTRTPSAPMADSVALERRLTPCLADYRPAAGAERSHPRVKHHHAVLGSRDGALPCAHGGKILHKWRNTALHIPIFSFVARRSDT